MICLLIILLNNLPGLEVQPSITTLSSYYSSKQNLAPSNVATNVTSSLLASVSRTIGTNIVMTTSAPSSTVINASFGVAVSSGSTSHITGGRLSYERTGHSHQVKFPTRSVQLQYCDVCKISCAGPQVFLIFSHWIWMFESWNSLDKLLFIVIIQYIDILKLTELQISYVIYEVSLFYLYSTSINNPLF